MTTKAATAVSTLAGHDYLQRIRKLSGEHWTVQDEADEADHIRAVEDAARQPVLDVLEWITEAMHLTDAVIPVRANVSVVDQTIREYLERWRT